MNQGLSDLESETRSEAALVDSAASPSLRFLGFEVAELPGVIGSYEHALFEAIEERNPQAITKRAKTVARLFPERQDALRFLGSIPEIEIRGDILTTGSRWDA